MNYKIKFSEIDDKVNDSSGVYEIFTNQGIPLKVGISKNLKKRLQQHRNSRQKYLKIKNHDLPASPSNIVSKQSILTKHLYFDKSITANYDLSKEIDRQNFLENECYIIITDTNSREEARSIEKEKEKMNFRYVGRIEIR